MRVETKNGKQVVRLSFRKIYGHVCEGSAIIVISEDTVVISHYIWSGDVPGAARRIAETITDKKLIDEKGYSGNGHGDYTYKAVDFNAIPKENK